MIVYVESNFVLEMARQQEEAAAAEEILRLAEESGIVLVFPEFALCEPFSTLTYYGSNRSRFVDAMEREFRELARLQPHKSLASLLQPLGPMLLSIERTEMEALQLTVARMLKIGRSIPLTASVFQEAQQTQRKLGLSIQDAIVYSSVIADLRAQRGDVVKCFLSRNPKDFDDPAINAELGSFGCRYIAKFTDGLSYIQNILK